MKTIRREWLFIWQFLCSPSFKSKPTDKIIVTKILSIALILISICFILNMAISVPFVKLYFCMGKDLVEDDFLSKGPLLSIFEGCLIIPILEEYLFRFYLNKRYGNLIYVFINAFILLYNFTNLSTNQIIAYILIAVFALLAISILLEKNYAFRRFFIILFQKHFYILFYLSAVTFGIVHVSNYQICHKHTVLVIFLVLPQLFAGLLLGYARLKYGIWSGIILHSLLNFIAIGLLFLTK